MWVDFAPLNWPNLFIVVNKIVPARSSEQHVLQANHQSLESSAMLRIWWFWATNYPLLQRQAPNKWMGINQCLTHQDNTVFTHNLRDKQYKLHFVLLNITSKLLYGWYSMIIFQAKSMYYTKGLQFPY